MVWVSSVLSNGELGDNLGLREKFKGHDWLPASREAFRMPKEIIDAMRRAAKGESLKRDEFPEASYVYNEKHFEKNAKDFFWASGFIVVKGKLARILQNFDLGEGGGLIPYPIYQKDKITPYEGEFFLLNFGTQKDTFLPNLTNSKQVVPLFTVERDGIELWDCKFALSDEDIAVSNKAFAGSDLWFEKRIYGKIFISDRLAQEFNEANLNFDMRLMKCRAVDEESGNDRIL